MTKSKICCQRVVNKFELNQSNTIEFDQPKSLKVLILLASQPESPMNKEPDVMYTIYSFRIHQMPEMPDFTAFLVLFVVFVLSIDSI